MNPATNLPLRDIHLPEAISWWPLAPGWWMLLGVMLFIIIATLLLWRLWQNKRVLRQLHEQLDNLKQSYQSDNDAVRTVRQLSILLRRACISYFPRNDVASLTGKDWLKFLGGISNNDQYHAGAGTLLLTGPYRSSQSIDNDQVTALIQLVENTLNRLHNKGKAR